MDAFSQVVGWIGATLVVLAYVLVSSRKVKGHDKSYQVMNLVGALGVGINAFHQEAWPSFAIQIVWGLVAIATLLKVRSLKNLD